MIYILGLSGFGKTNLKSQVKLVISRLNSTGSCNECSQVRRLQLICEGGSSTTTVEVLSKAKNLQTVVVLCRCGASSKELFRNQ